ncbi:MAG: hypothetical protein GVY10_06190 [Verrucomicrobia bacterium]|jgi:Flp pilus assembly protein TadD|nr:hypothetical protein [Verrucomicrobiota bacterium]
MKIPALILAVFLLLTGGLLLLLWISAPASSIEFDQAAFAELPAGEQNRLIDEILARPALPPGQEDAVLKWIFRNDHRRGKILLQDNAFAIRMLPEHLASSAMELVESGDLAEGIEALALARQSFPNDPNVLSAAGAVAFLGGRRDDARRLLEEAENWRINNPRTDFYLGGLLITAESSAEKARGKSLLLRVVESGTGDLAERSALALLTNRTLPMTDDEKAALLGMLKREGTFRTENPYLNAEVLRILANIASRVRHELALPLADLLLDYPGSTKEDQLGYVELAQELDEYEEAGERLDALRKLKGFSEASQVRLRRLILFQHIAAGRYMEAERLWDRMAKLPEAEESLAPVVLNILEKEDLSNEAERLFLEKFLDLPVLNVALSLRVLDRLVEIRPVQEDQWIKHATEKLLAREPIRVGGWLTSLNAQKAIIPVLEERMEALETEEKRALVEAYLAEEEAEKAIRLLPDLKSGIHPALYAFYETRCRLQQSDREAAFEAWNAAHNAALGSNAFALLKNIGFLALRMDQPVNALQSLYTAFTAGVPFTRRQSTRLQELTLAHGTLRQTLKVAGNLAEKYPEDPDFTNNLAYFKFIANEEVDRHLAIMRKLVEEYPNNLPYNLTLALGLLQSGREREANQTLQQTTVDWSEADPRQKMIYAAVLTANGQRVVAQGLTQNLDREALIPEEQALLDSL